MCVVAQKKIGLILRTGCLLLLFRVAVHAQMLPSSVPLAPGARVLMVEDQQAVHAFQVQPQTVRAMVERGLLKLVGATNLTQCWKTMVATNDVIGIKVSSATGPISGTRPAVAAAIAQTLIESGIDPTNIVLWDRHLSDLRLAGYTDIANRLHVRLAGSSDSGYSEDITYDSPILGTLVWGDLEFGRKDAKGRKSHISKLLTSQLTKIIVVAPLFNHYTAGINGCLCSLALGSADNTSRFEIQADRLAKAVPELYAMEPLSDHVVLCVMDALIAQYEGEALTQLHYSTELNQIWFSKDPVALDTLGIQTLSQERELHRMPSRSPNMALYETASFIELGVSDVKRIQVDLIK